MGLIQPGSPSLPKPHGTVREQALPCGTPNWSRASSHALVQPCFQCCHYWPSQLGHGAEGVPQDPVWGPYQLLLRGGVAL